MSTTEASPNGTPAHEVLAWSRQHVEPALHAAVDTLTDDMRHVAGYHFGWWDEHGHPAQAGGGKALRSALVLLSAQAVGGTAASAIPAAAAVELVHNFSLLHDDVMDQDATRRHRPTAWSVFGINAALLAGNALSALASAVLANSGHPAALQGVRKLNTAVQDLIQGQIMDIGFVQRSDVDLPECERMAQAKTGALLGAACELGGAFGNATPEQTTHLRRFGENLGLAFQHVDDVLGIWGDPEITGKPAYSDLYGRKKTLPIVAALHSGTPAGRELAVRYEHETPFSHAELVDTAGLIDSAGGRAWSTQQAGRLLDQALAHLREVGPSGRTATLKALARLAAHRDQ